MSIKLETDRLYLIPGTQSLTRAAIEDISLFSNKLGAEVPKEWPHELLKDAEPYFADVLNKNPSETGWWIWYLVLKGAEPSQNILIGNACFKGPPSENGTVEIGYAILDSFQMNGYATEAMQALIRWAFTNTRVIYVIGETYPSLTPSIKVMEKLGMKLIGKGSEENTIRFSLEKTIMNAKLYNVALDQ